MGPNSCSSKHGSRCKRPSPIAHYQDSAFSNLGLRHTSLLKDPTVYAYVGEFNRSWQSRHPALDKAFNKILRWSLMDFRFRVIDLIIALRCLIVVQNDFVLLIILDNRKRWFSLIHIGMRCLPSDSDYTAWGLEQVNTGLISFMVY